MGKLTRPEILVIQVFIFLCPYLSLPYFMWQLRRAIRLAKQVTCIEIFLYLAPVLALICLYLRSVSPVKRIFIILYWYWLCFPELNNGIIRNPPWKHIPEFEIEKYIA